MTMADSINGPIWILWIVTAIFFVISIILLSGHGSGLIAGFNTASKKEKEKYDKKKLCKFTGIGMAAISLVFLFVSLFFQLLPSSFSYVLGVFILIDAIIIIILQNTICKR